MHPSTSEPTISTHTDTVVNELRTQLAEVRAENTQIKGTLQELRTQYDTLRTDNTTLRTQLQNLQAVVAQLQQPPPPNPVRDWHQQANNIIGTLHSRTTQNVMRFDCAHAHDGSGCNWCKKKVTLQAYVLHLQRKHGENISTNANIALLPVLSP